MKPLIFVLLVWFSFVFIDHQFEIDVPRGLYLFVGFVFIIFLLKETSESAKYNIKKAKEIFSKLKY